MQKALFIHGLNSDENSSTGQIVKTLLEKYGIELIVPSFDILNPEKTLQEINSLIRDLHISTIVGHSMGGFYTLASLNGPIKIYINPCLLPAEILPALIGDVDQELIKIFRRLTDEAFRNIDREVRITSYSIFAKEDTLFSFYDLFKKYFGNRCRYINGSHKPSKEDLAQALDFALNLIKSDIKCFLKEDEVLGKLLL
ncbi:hypothetical protein E4O03_07225 [Treponema sp. OMZ 792]|uniref:YqiA/YcfP family alpha/beta fold hydrolase n=1 Tax=unclassified Treponema TaxID=2638727 RepID=UPI0020A259AD|nr:MULTISPECIES: YqiA/YcfP family alpha/beta fold hydrolase [unclassified Treponema]UTC74046.1 hypothetical protein E4O03_07225 [Treponema sp. OMZ 792]UTC80446.1 hypothetical protein E4O07_07125 [Treponema sp. OMZ 798]